MLKLQSTSRSLETPLTYAVTDGNHMVRQQSLEAQYQLNQRACRGLHCFKYGWCCKKSYENEGADASHVLYTQSMEQHSFKVGINVMCQQFSFKTKCEKWSQPSASELWS